MNEKGLVVLEQYELDVRNARRGRGSFLVDTEEMQIQGSLSEIILEQ